MEGIELWVLLHLLCVSHRSISLIFFLTSSVISLLFFKYQSTWILDKAIQHQLLQNTHQFQSVNYFNIIDKNQDNFLNKQEARQFLQSKRNISLANNLWFSKLDQNNDGLISPNEFDKDLNRNMLEIFRNQKNSNNFLRLLL